MHFHETPLAGAFAIDLDEKPDARGFFARSFCAAEFKAHGLTTVIVQSNLSFNHLRGTLRGMHYQSEPATEAKLVRCLRGAIYDVIVDMRPASLTYLQHFGIELNEANRRMLYVPEMFAHGYQALTDGAEVSYQVSAFYAPECERGLRHDDPGLGIVWPIPVTAISEKDTAWPLIASKTGK
ncbi:MAG: dTDP-4-dehydrorhamnose 3,5-epimerase [Beijerinckiaceae bacterium]|nr:dTDP-4-dehydrorhamnose 3,5-epimerase [Beijerinckiaceae bacterium]